MLQASVFFYFYVFSFFVLMHCISILLFILLPVSGHLGCFKFLAFVNKAAVNTILHVFGMYVHLFALVIY